MLVIKDLEGLLTCLDLTLLQERQMRAIETVQVANSVSDASNPSIMLWLNSTFSVAV